MDENIINYMNNIENTNLSEEDKEFEKYLKLFKERFGRIKKRIDRQKV